MKTKKNYSPSVRKKRCIQTLRHIVKGISIFFYTFSLIFFSGSYSRYHCLCIWCQINDAYKLSPGQKWKTSNKITIHESVFCFGSEDDSVARGTHLRSKWIISIAFSLLKHVPFSLFFSLCGIQLKCSTNLKAFRVSMPSIVLLLHIIFLFFIFLKKSNRWHAENNNFVQYERRLTFVWAKQCGSTKEFYVCEFYI